MQEVKQKRTRLKILQETSLQQKYIPPTAHTLHPTALTDQLFTESIALQNPLLCNQLHSTSISPVC